MPRAAVPQYLGRDFRSASPGMRFGMYLRLWTDQKDQPNLWEKNNFMATKDMWDEVVKLSPGDQALARALLQRQQDLIARLPQEAVFVAHARSVAPFTTGLGNEHPLENGFAFLNPHGLPYFPASGVKGVLRQAARQLASGEWEDHGGWTMQGTFPVSLEGEQLLLSPLDVLFGLESSEGSTTHVRGALTFWDVIPQCDTLLLEIMTPHQTHYYQKKKDRRTGDSVSPHDSGQPIPVKFLTVPPDSVFVFHVHCDLAHLRRLAPSLAEGGMWKTLLEAALRHAFQWLGFGAKTSVGYGTMAFEEKPHPAREAPLREAPAGPAPAQETLTEGPPLSKNMQTVEEFRQKMKEQFQRSRGRKDRPHTTWHDQARNLARLAREGEDWSPDEKRAAAEAITEWLPKVVQVDMKEEKKKMKLEELYRAGGESSAGSESKET